MCRFLARALQSIIKREMFAHCVSLYVCLWLKSIRIWHTYHITKHRLAPLRLPEVKAQQDVSRFDVKSAMFSIFSESIFILFDTRRHTDRQQVSRCSCLFLKIIFLFASLSSLWSFILFTLILQTFFFFCQIDIQQISFKLSSICLNVNYKEDDILVFFTAHTLV